MTILYILLFLNCNGWGQTKKIETYDQYRQQKIEYRDSLFILYTVKEWGKLNWYTWGIRDDLYKITSDDVKYFICGTFYSPDKSKILVWIGRKMPNAQTIKIYDKDKPNINKLCPSGEDTIYTLSAIIGTRDSLNKTWKLYPFDQQQATCFDSKDKVINVLGKYYFEKMKAHQMYKMMQEGEKKGFRELQPYGYNLQEKDFWNKCWLWQRDTVGSYGLYPFQIKGYNSKGEKCNQKCAEPFNTPQINYPNEILNLFE